MPPNHRRRPAGVRAPRVAGRVPAGTTSRPAEESAVEARATEPEAGPVAPEADGSARTAPARRPSRPRGIASVLPTRMARTAAPAVEGPAPVTDAPAPAAEDPAAVTDALASGADAPVPDTGSLRSDTDAEAPGTGSDTVDPEEGKERADGGTRRTRSVISRLPVATTRKAAAVVAAVAVLLFAAAAFLGVSWWRTAHSAAAENTALVDVATTAQVSQQLGDAVKKVYSFDYTRLDQNEKAARDVITPDFQADYDKLFEQVRALGTQQQAVVSATISQIAVREIHGDTAVAVVFVDQQATKAAASDGQTQAASAGRLTVTGKLVDGVWKIADVQVV
ncbi:hypothetical protein [Pseudonocardia sp. N23]|uniref:hypothetical protein n=1 Tax=Pseudonocardia sp. N23 TaxID=1987376 RepID=UPI000BFBF6BC|nr:hypothetical protein [Pseudonocardia sp. N23]GAY10214.1 putative integral membrane protein [Pseudonocardia sp. N23]